MLIRLVGCMKMCENACCRYYIYCIPPPISSNTGSFKQRVALSDVWCDTLVFFAVFAPLLVAFVGDDDLWLVLQFTKCVAWLITHTLLNSPTNSHWFIIIVFFVIYFVSNITVKLGRWNYYACFRFVVASFFYLLLFRFRN